MSFLKAIDSDGAQLDIDAKHVDTLRAALKGPLLTPADAGYEDSRTVWNAMIDRRPALVARCIGAADIAACLRFARETGIAFSIKGGGHNIAGLAVCDGGLLLDLSLQRGVWVDPKARIAHAQPGCLLADVDRETQLHGLVAPLGFVSATGVTGLTLGGGFGYLTRRFGYTTDHVRSMTVITADGRLVRASENENADLFWGLRGGGGNFGAVTDIEFALTPLGPEIYGGGIAWPAERAPEVLDLFRKTMSDGPPELTFACVMRKAPPAPWIAKEAHGTHIIALFVCWSGPVDEGEKVMAPVRALGGMVGDIVQRRPYTTLQALLDATQPKGRRYYWKSEYLSTLSDDLLNAYRGHAARIQSPHTGAILFHLGDVLGKLPVDHSAVGNRDVKCVLNLAAAWEKADEDATHVEWARSAWRDLKRYSTGGTYINFLTEEDAGDRIAAAYGSNLDRLKVIKRAWDPENFFRANKNIAP